MVCGQKSRTSSLRPLAHRGGGAGKSEVPREVEPGGLPCPRGLFHITSPQVAQRPGWGGQCCFLPGFGTQSEKAAGWGETQTQGTTCSWVQKVFWVRVGFTDEKGRKGQYAEDQRACQGQQGS